MQRFFFDVHDHELSKRDEAGELLEDDEAAHREGVRVAGETLSARKPVKGFLAFSVEVRDAMGSVARIAVSLTSERLTRPSPPDRVVS